MIDARLRDYLDHMAEAAKQSIEYLQEMERDEFLADRRTQQAVIFNMIVPGEAATRILNDFPEFSARNETIPWASMKGMRNRIARSEGFADSA